MRNYRKISCWKRRTYAADNFIAKHKGDYTPSPESAAQLQRYITEHNLPLNEYTLEQAHAALTGRNPNAATVQSQPQPQHRAVATGLSDTAGPGIPNGEDELDPKNIAARMATMDSSSARVLMQQMMVKVRQRQGERF